MAVALVRDVALVVGIRGISETDDDSVGWWSRNSFGCGLAWPAAWRSSSLLTRFWIDGRAVGVGEVKFRGGIKPDIKCVRYEVHMRQVRRGKLAVGIADGSVFADGTCVYLARNMRVGMISSAD